MSRRNNNKNTEAMPEAMPILETFTPIVEPVTVPEVATEPVVTEPVNPITALFAMLQSMVQPIVTLVRALADGIVIPTATDIFNAYKATRVGTASWPYMHAKDGKHDEEHQGRYGNRYHARIVVLDGLQATDDPSRFIITGLTFWGGAVDATGIVDRAAWTPRPESMPRMVLRVNGTLPNANWDTMLATMKGAHKQCADWRNASVTLDVAEGKAVLSITGNGNRGGSYGLSAVFMADGTRIG